MSELPAALSHLVTGEGAFRPDEGTAELQRQVDSLRAELAGVENRNVALQQRVAACTRQVTDAASLEELLDERLPEHQGIEITGDTDTLTIEVRGLTLDDYGDIVRPTIDFVVSATIEVEVFIEVQATSEDEAYEQAEEALDWADVDVTTSGDLFVNVDATSTSDIRVREA